MATEMASAQIRNDVDVLENSETLFEIAEVCLVIFAELHRIVEQDVLEDILEDRIVPAGHGPFEQLSLLVRLDELVNIEQFLGVLLALWKWALEIYFFGDFAGSDQMLVCVYFGKQF